MSIESEPLQIQNRPVAVRIGNTGKLFYYDAGELELKTNNRVRIKLGDGIEIATVVLETASIEAARFVQPLPRIEGRDETPEATLEIAQGSRKQPCQHEPCCQNWQQRFNPPDTACTYLVCTARWQPGQYEEMQARLPAVGQKLCE